MPYELGKPHAGSLKALGSPEGLENLSEISFIYPNPAVLHLKPHMIFVSKGPNVYFHLRGKLLQHS